MTREQEVRLLEALGIRKDRRINRLQLTMTARSAPHLLIEEIPDDPSVQGLVLALSEYMLVPKGPLWLVGQFREKTETVTAWDFQGVFLEREEAVQACKGETWFVAPVTLGEELQEGSFVFRDVEYPLASEVADAGAN